MAQGKRGDRWLAEKNLSKEEGSHEIEIWLSFFYVACNTKPGHISSIISPRDQGAQRYFCLLKMNKKWMLIDPCSP